MRFIITLIFLSSVSFAQPAQQPQKESTDDLRSHVAVFSIEDLDDENLIVLERSPGHDFHLRLKDDDGEFKLKKVTTQEAAKLEKEFAAKFIKCQFELPMSPEGCKAEMKLSMKGELQDICGKDEKKTQELKPFYKDLLKRFE